MGLYNFQPRFAPFIRDGRKTHTIRAQRCNPDKPGNTLHLYIGLRHKSVELLMRVPCVKVEEIFIKLAPGGVPVIYIDGQPLDGDECESLSIRDGFDSFADMMQFWEGRLPFRGHIIHWKFPEVPA
jgi:hypothetical protein